MRKLVYGALALSAALAVGFGVNAADASAATSYKFTITPRADGTGDMLTIEASGATNLFVAPTSLAKQTGKDSSGAAYADTAYVKAAGLNAWDKYENNGTSGMFDIDLSKFSAKQDKFFLVKVDWETDADAVLVEVPAGKTLKSATWKKDGGISIKKGDGKIYGSAAGEENPGSEYAFSGSLAFKGSNPHVDGTSSEGSLFELDPSTYGIYTQNGATLSMYGKADTTTKNSVETNDGSGELYKTSSVTYKKILDKKNGNPITFYKTNQRTGAPVKLTIPKRPSAGAITVDYVNGKVTIPKGTKVEFTASGGAINVYKTAGGGTSGINAQASATDYSDSASNGKLKAQTTFWLGSVNKLLDSSAVATNYVLDSAKMTAPFCIEVSKAGGTYFTDSKVARTSFAGKESSISNNSVDYYEKSTSNDKLSAPTVDTKLVYGSGKYTLEFYNASIEKSYEIHIKEKNSTNTKETFLTLKPTGKKSADDSTALGRKKVTYKTNIVDGDDLAKKLCKDGELEIEIRELGVKADATLPSVSVKVDGLTAGSPASGFNFVGKDTGVNDNRKTIEVRAFDVYKGDTSDALGNAANKLTPASSGAVRVVKAAPKTTLTVKVDSGVKVAVLNGTTKLNTKEVKNGSGAIVGYSFTMPNANVKIEQVYDITTMVGTTASSISSTVYKYTSSDSKSAISSLTGLSAGTRLYIEIAEQKTISFKDGATEIDLTGAGVSTNPKKNTDYGIEEYYVDKYDGNGPQLSGYQITVTKDFTIVEADKLYTVTLPAGWSAQKSKTESASMNLATLKKGDTFYIKVATGETVSTSATVTGITLTPVEDNGAVVGYNATITGTKGVGNNSITIVKNS